MNNRERFLKTLRFESVDHPPLILPGEPWASTKKRWESEGLPAGVDLYEYFELEPYAARPVGVETLLYPPFEERILEESGEFIIKIDQHGVKVRNFRDESSMAEHLEYPIKGPEDIQWLRDRLNWDTPGRIRDDWLEDAREGRDRGQILFCNGGEYFAFLNEQMGTAALMFAYVDNPEFVHQVNELLCVLCENALKTVLPEFDLDYIGYHEDMAYKTGSMISPAMFREFMTPYYRRIAEIADAHDADLRVMDSDGNIEELIPLWLECGINVVGPVEVAAGMDVVRLREEYGKDLRMIGGFDKRILASSTQEIEMEFERIRPVIEAGGYIPMCDHIVPPDVPFENYCHLVALLKGLYGTE